MYFTKWFAHRQQICHAYEIIALISMSTKHINSTPHLDTLDLNPKLEPEYEPAWCWQNLFPIIWAQHGEG